MLPINSEIPNEMQLVFCGKQFVENTSTKDLHEILVSIYLFFYYQRYFLCTKLLWITRSFSPEKTKTSSSKFSKTFGVIKKRSEKIYNSKKFIKVCSFLWCFNFIGISVSGRSFSFAIVDYQFS